jgi:predicted nucleic acid-binding protein
VTPAFVVDASVAVAWVHPGQATPHTARMLDAVAEGTIIEVPALWPLEVANALTVLVRRRKLTEGDRQAALGWFRALPLRVDHEMAALAFSTLSALAAKYGVSAYDAAYLELAQRRKLPLGCRDGPLLEAAARYGLAVWGRG